MPRHSTAQHSTAQQSTAQHSTAQHSTAQHGMTFGQHSLAVQLGSTAWQIIAINAFNRMPET